MKRTKFLHRTRTDFLLIVIFNNHGIGKSSFFFKFYERNGMLQLYEN